MSEVICPCSERLLLSAPAMGFAYVAVFREPATHAVVDSCPSCARPLYSALCAGELLEAATKTPVEVPA